MPNRLDGIRLKIARGHQHLVSLDGQISEFRENHPHRVELIRTDKPDWWASVLRADPLTLEFGVVLSDALQQLRSALDHLAYQLAILRKPSASGPNFPIYTDKTRWLTPTGSGRRKESPCARYRAAFDKDAFALVERLQPFNTPPPVPQPSAARDLTDLQRLSNLDKHETIQAGYLMVKSASFTHDQVLKYTGHVLRFHDGPVEDGTPLDFLRVRATDDEMKVHMPTIKVELGVAFGIPVEFLGIPITTDRIREIGDRIGTIVDEFEETVPALRS